ncbi:MAG: polyprenyl synthetase family protein [Desulfatiglans sp.]|nr:polyprenyl synthetase family protein [Desulfatiglans sp.]
MHIYCEKPQKADELEWWFCHGYYQLESTLPTFFMTSFFKTLSNHPGPNLVGYSLINTLISVNESSHTFNSCIDTGAHAVFLSRLKEVHESTISSHLKDAYLGEIEEYGPPSPIVLKQSSPIVAEEVLNIEWDSYHLFQQDNYFGLRFSPDEKNHYNFILKPQYERLDLISNEQSQFGGMAYLSYPRMALSGTANGVKISGRAWLDHQFGDFSWLQRGENKEPLAWIWAGINLDDSTDVVFIQHLDARTGQSLHRRVWIRYDSGRIQDNLEVEIETVREWESPHTHIHYPIEFRLRVPEVDMVLDLKPLADAQEIPIFGFQRAIWEGAGVASGILKGDPVRGNARIELNGFGFIFDSKEYINSFVETIDKHLEDFLPKKIDKKWLVENIAEENWLHEPEGITEVISKPAWDFLSRSGKHWRPLCSMLLLESAGVPSAPYAKMISAFTELNHSGSLIIDDIEDDSLIRRGAESLHLKYGIDVAINLGNSLYFLPYLLLKDHPHLTENQRLEIYKLIIQVWTRAHLGQGLDIYWSKNLSKQNLDKWIRDSLDKKLLQMYAFKTGASVEAVAEMACILSGGSVEKRRVFATLGRVFGVAFQIIDDVNNFSQSPGWTKTCGEDITAGKPTYVIVTTLKMLSREERKTFLEIFCSPDLRREKEYLEKSIVMVRNSGALEVCRKEAEEMIDREWKNFKRYAFHCDSKIMLRMLISSLLNYSHDV